MKRHRAAASKPAWHEGCGRWGAIPLWVLDAGVSPRAVQLFALLAARYANREGVCWPSRERLARDMGCSTMTVYRALQELERIGAVTIEDRRPHPCIYRLHGKPATGGTHPEAAKDSPQHDTRDHITHDNNTGVHIKDEIDNADDMVNAPQVSGQDNTHVARSNVVIEPEPEPVEPDIPPSPTSSLRSLVGVSPPGEARAGEPPQKADGDEASQPAYPGGPSPREVVAAWNEICGDVLPKVRNLTPERAAKIRRRTTGGGAGEVRDLEWWRALFRRVARSRFCTGRIPRQGKHARWRATLDWVIRSETVIERILEGVYDDPEDTQTPGQKGVRQDGDPDDPVEHYTRWIGYPEIIQGLAASGDPIARQWCERYGYPVPARADAG